MKLPTIDQLVLKLGLQAHPEGGYYKETYRSQGKIPASALPGFTGERNHATAIYYLLGQGDFSAFHRIRQDETWHYYMGAPLLLHEIDPRGNYRAQWIGPDIASGQLPQYVVAAGHWFAAEPAPGTDYCLMGCTVAPGFDFADFELAEAQELITSFPQHSELIRRLTR